MSNEHKILETKKYTGSHLFTNAIIGCLKQYRWGVGKVKKYTGNKRLAMC